MFSLSIINHYLVWHYGYAFIEIWHVWRSFFWFTINFFSVPQLLKSLFAPYKRVTTERGETFNLEDLAGFIIINIVSRFIGLFLRVAILLVAVLALVVLSIGIILTYIAWVTAPIVLFGFMYYGISLIIFGT